MLRGAHRGMCFAALALGVGVFVFVLASTRSWLAEARQEPQTYAYSFSDGTTINLPAGWVARDVAHLPPPVFLASSAPPLTIYEIHSFENAGDHSELHVAISNDPFLGRNAPWLDTEMHQPASSGRGMVSYLFYFFFPPPLQCLEGASTEYERAARDAQSHADKDSPPADITVNHECQYAPTLPDFYSFLVSNGVTFRRTDGVEHHQGSLHNLYLAPMEQHDFDRQTFFVFEAQGQQQIRLATTNHFNLPDSLQGMQPDFFWAIGAPSPLPFIRDVTRKNVPLIHVVYASVGPGPNRKPDFMAILRTVRLPRGN